MFHRLLAGYFDANAVVSSRKLIVTRPIDLSVVSRLAQDCDFEGDGVTFRVADDVLKIENGYVDCPWLSPRVNRKAVEFMLRLNERTDCMFVDLGHGEIVGADVLRESIGIASDS